MPCVPARRVVKGTRSLWPCRRGRAGSRDILVRTAGNRPSTGLLVKLVYRPFLCFQMRGWARPGIPCIVRRRGCPPVVLVGPLDKIHTDAHPALAFLCVPVQIAAGFDLLHGGGDTLVQLQANTWKVSRVSTTMSARPRRVSTSESTRTILRTMAQTIGSAIWQLLSAANSA